MINTICDLKKRLTQLIEVNHALSHDLDMSRRSVAELGRERDLLKKRVVEMEDSSQAQIYSIQTKMTKEQNKSMFFEREREELKRDIAEARERMVAAEQQVYRLARKVKESEQEKDALKSQLDESMEAMDEIRHWLVESSQLHTPLLNTPEAFHSPPLSHVAY